MANRYIMLYYHVLGSVFFISKLQSLSPNRLKASDTAKLLCLRLQHGYITYKFPLLSLIIQVTEANYSHFVHWRLVLSLKIPLSKLGTGFRYYACLRAHSSCVPQPQLPVAVWWMENAFYSCLFTTCIICQWWQKVHSQHFKCIIFCVL